MENKDQLSLDLFQLFTSLYRHLASAFSNKIVGGLTFTQLQILKLIAFGNDTVSDLAQKMKISPAAVSKMVEHIVQSGLISRIRSEEDRRIARLELTQKGKEVLKTNMEIRQEVIKKVLVTFSAEDVQMLKTMVEKIIESLQDDLL